MGGGVNQEITIILILVAIHDESVHYSNTKCTMFIVKDIPGYDVLLEINVYMYVREGFGG